MTSHATTLFAKPTLLRGMARVLDIGSTMNIYNDSDSINEADEIALASDWYAVGEDLSEAIGGYEDGEQESTQ